MKLSTKGHYGMHAMMDLGAHHGEGVTLLRELCGSHGFSEKYVEQLLRSLRQSGLIESVRGAHGGYWLAKEPRDITILEIVEALEGEFDHHPSKCKTDCAKRDHCAMLETWERSMRSLKEVLSSRTLGDLLDQQQELDRGQAPIDYSI